MINRLTKYKKESLLFISSFLLLFFSFQHNTFKVAEHKWFTRFGADSESLVIARLVKSQHEGIFSSQGHLVFYDRDSEDFASKPTKIYEGILQYNNMKNVEYTSQVGIQGIFYSILDKSFNKLNIVNIKNRINIYHAITSSLLALVLASIVVLFYLEIGAFASIFLLLSLILSQWIAVMARNLYWVEGLMYVPFLAIFAMHKYEELKGHISLKLLYFLAFSTVMIRCFNGYEYISTILISMVVPIIYFAVKNNWNIVLAVKRIIFTGLFGLFGFLTALLLHIWQLQLSTHSFTKAWGIILRRILTRTSGNPDGVPEHIRKSLESSFFEIIHTYLNGTAIDLSTIFGFKFFKFITYEDLIWCFLIGSIFVFTDFKLIKEHYNKLLALTVATWVSFFAPISWFVLAKGHSYIHTHINYILWHLPFTIFGYALVGFIGYLLLKTLYIRSRYIFSISLGVVALLFITTSTINAYKELNMIVDEITKQTLLEVTIDPLLSIHLTQKNRLIYHIKNCQKTDTENMFFLHIYPSNQKDLIHQKHPFNNFDFKWDTNKVLIPEYSMYDSDCFAVVKLPDYHIKSIDTGRYAEGKIFWRQAIDFNVTSGLMVPYNLSDVAWKNGISRSKSTFFIENSIGNRLAIQKNSILKFPFSGARRVIEISSTKKYLNIDVNGSQLDPIKDGYPNKIEILKGEEK